eukprot:gene14706-25663_t
MEQTACSGYSAKHRTQRRHFATSAAVANDEVDVAAAFEEIQAAGLLPPDPPLPSPLPVRQEPRQRRQDSDEPSHYTPVYTNKHGSKKAKVKTKMKTMTTTKMKTKKKKKKKMQKNETATRTETKTEKTTWYSDPTELQISELLAQRSPSATQEAWALLATVEEDGTVHVGHYNQMINACRSSDQIRDLISTRMTTSPNSGTYFRLVQMLAIEGDLEGAVQVITEDITAADRFVVGYSTASVELGCDYAVWYPCWYSRGGGCGGGAL